MTLKAKHVLEWSIFSFLFLVLLLSGSLFFYQKAYAGKIYPNVSVAGIDLSGKTKIQAETLLLKDISNLSQKDVTLVANDKEVTTKVSETGLSADVSQAVDSAYSEGRSKNFFYQLWFSAKKLVKKNDLTVPILIDKAKFDAFVAAKIPGLEYGAKDASLSIENGVVKDSPEQAGQKVDTGNLGNQILALANDDKNKNQYRVTLTTTPAVPAVVLSNTALARQTAEQLMAKKITFTCEDKTFTPTKADIGGWISFNLSNGQYMASLSDTGIKAYINKIAKNIEVEKVDKKISALDNSVIDPGHDGKYVDKDGAVKTIKAQINKSDTFTVAMATFITPAGEIKVFPAEGLIPGRFQGKYIDIDLAQQKLCAVDTNDIQGCWTISSGKASTPTPVGTRVIQDKNPMAWSAPYGLYMPWWNGMGGGYGIHELPEWPGGYKEGENHLGTPVSHGCVRLGVGPAEYVYNWAPIGTPVYIHK